ncbi:neutral ceramidase B, partial [Nephila pilipes]
MNNMKIDKNNIAKAMYIQKFTSRKSIITIQDDQNEKCIAFGPGKDMFESTEIIARKQYEKAMELFESANSLISGPIGYAHQFIDMSNQTIKLNKTTS